MTIRPTRTRAGALDRSERDTSDIELVERAKAGDRSAIVALYQRYVREVFGYVFNQVGVVEEAEDVTSEIFLNFVRSIDGFRGHSSVRTWLYQIARNRLRDRWRTSGRRPRVVDLDPELTAIRGAGDRYASHDPLATPAEDAPNEHATLLGETILSALPPRHRRVLELRIMDGRSVRDTADEMGTTPGNVKVLQHRALKRAVRVAEDLGLAPRTHPSRTQRTLRSET